MTTRNANHLLDDLQGFEAASARHVLSTALYELVATVERETITEETIRRVLVNSLHTWGCAEQIYTGEEAGS